MKIPLKINIDLWPSRSMPDRQKQNVEKSPHSFNKLLTNRIKSIKEKGSPFSAALPMGKGELRQLVENIQLQMNDSFFSAFTESDEDNTFHGFHNDWMNFRETGNRMEYFLSTIQHILQQRGRIQSQPDIDLIIDHASKRYGVDPDLTRAVIRAESDFDANCTSHKGAMGLMQLMPETAKELGVKNAYDPVENIMGGTRYLKSLLVRYDGNIPVTLAAYNWGMGNVERNPDRLPRETRTYIARVNRYYRDAKS